MKKRSHSLKGKKHTSKVLSIVIGIITLLIVAAFAVIIVMAVKDNPATVSDDTDALNNSSSDRADSPSKNAAEPEETFDHASEIRTVRVEGEPEAEFVNELTGEAVSEEIAAQRPVAIMINNIRVACPQIGVSNADVMYEVLAEGGITRLLMVTKDYEALDVVGSVRSSREYYLDFTRNHDAIYVHAGGSDEAYADILSRDIEHLDGVNGDAATGINVTGSCFYRDSDRRYSMGYEHSMMTTGELIAKGISIMGYRTALKTGFEDPINIIKNGYKVELDGADGRYARMTYYTTNSPEYEYDEASGDYLRYQYGHTPHIDGATGEQLAFTNVLILVMDHQQSGDSYGHLFITTTGQGRGYYLTGGKMVEINWSRDNEDEPMELTDSEGYPLLLNKGKTAINIISPEIEDTLVIGME